MVGFAASLLINALIIIPGLTDESEADLIPLDSTKSPVFEPDLPDPDDVKLGIEESEASTLTWIGYEEYRKSTWPNWLTSTKHNSQLEVALKVVEATRSQFPSPRLSKLRNNRHRNSLRRRRKPQPEAAPSQPPLPEVPDPTLPKVSQTDAEQEATEPSETLHPKNPPSNSLPPSQLRRVHPRRSLNQIPPSRKAVMQPPRPASRIAPWGPPARAPMTYLQSLTQPIAKLMRRPRFQSISKNPAARLQPRALMFAHDDRNSLRFRRCSLVASPSSRGSSSSSQESLAESHLVVSTQRQRR